MTRLSVGAEDGNVGCRKPLQSNAQRAAASRREIYGNHHAVVSTTVLFACDEHRTLPGSQYFPRSRPKQVLGKAARAVGTEDYQICGVVDRCACDLFIGSSFLNCG
jgi:hypothetical protein